MRTTIMRFKAVVLYNNVRFTLADRDIDLVWNVDTIPFATEKEFACLDFFLFSNYTLYFSFSAICIARRFGLCCHQGASIIYQIYNLNKKVNY